MNNALLQTIDYWPAKAKYFIIIIWGAILLFMTVKFNISPYYDQLASLNKERLSIDQQIREQRRHLIPVSRISRSSAAEDEKIHYLKDVKLDAIHYVGLIKSQSKCWALITTKTQALSYVQKGNYLGRSKAEVVSINEKQLELREPRPHDGTILYRKTILNLKS